MPLSHCAPRDNEATIGQAPFKATAADLVRFSKQCDSQWMLVSSNLDPNASEEIQECLQAISSLIKECAPVALELLQRFDKLDQIKNHKASGLGAMKSRLDRMMMVWKRDEITSRIDQLSACQSQLSLRLLQYLTLRFDMANTSLEQRYSKIVEVLTISEDRVRTIEEQNQSISRSLEASQLQAEDYHEQTIAALLTREDGEVKFIRPKDPQKAHIYNGPQKLLTLRTEPGSAPPAPTIQDFKPMQERILRYLYHEELSHRYESVNETHAKTYEWIFQKPTTQSPQVRWSPFPQWLEKGSGCYWINGKAGSGKSTLAKFICEDPRTGAALKKWAKSANRELCYASARLEKRHGEVWKEIVDQIGEKSCGVFLWVVLVVRSVLVGLQNWDSLDEILQRLDELPSDLKDLYAHMLKRMPLSYRQQASELFQIAVHFLDVQPDELMTPLQLHFATAINDIMDILKWPIEYLCESDQEKAVDSIEGRLRSRCCGLLEVRQMKFHMVQGFSSSILREPHVHFIHRTAVEFLHLPGIWSDILSLTAETDFNSSVSLFRSCLLLCKAQPSELRIRPADNLVWHYMTCAMEYASLAEDASSPVSSILLDELDRVIRHHWEAASRFEFGDLSCETKGHWAQGFSMTAYSDLPQSLQLLEARSISMGLALEDSTRPFGFHTLAVLHSLHNFLRERPPPTDNSHGASPSTSTRLLTDALNYLFYKKTWTGQRSKAIIQRYADICTLLLSQGADPNATFPHARKGPWGLMLEFGLKGCDDVGAFRGPYRTKGSSFVYSRLLVSFIQAGADPHHLVNSSSTSQFGRQGLAYSIQQIIDILFAQNINGPRHLQMQEEPDTEMKSFHGYLSGLIQQSISTYQPTSEQQSTTKPYRSKRASFLRRNTKSTNDVSMSGSTSSSMKKFGQLLAPWKRNSDSSSQRSLSDIDENGL
ncbi:hypothetical protein SAPIO_CDS6626 [Scedosporium apiospermum]|uniref:NACHT domain-containing protein n=1 Tax=Pseudallescheria apiosperma TaxID=563466 RepID=A0A084G3L0_PSEDA|nr:uncharacterized protein SAPIO_CDS6626 [Scedosporium apiospermum]KEZ41922.1 hypothetical protein SAPIO_CDS6626 [Scedosporium apiospermum]